MYTLEEKQQVYYAWKETYQEATKNLECTYIVNFYNIFIFLNYVSSKYSTLFVGSNCFPAQNLPNFWNFFIQLKELLYQNSSF